MEKLDGFRKWLDRAVRCDEGSDWTAHSVDYSLFKQRLKFFARRRSRLRTLLNDSHDGKIPETILNNLLQVAPRSGGFALPTVIHTEPTPTSENNPEGYVAFVDTDYSSDMSSQGSERLPTKRKTRRTVMRRLSIAERQEMVAYLATEMEKAHHFYMEQWQTLSERLDRHHDTNSNLDATTTDLGDEILELLAFCVTTVVAASQALIRYDAYARASEGMPMLHFYLKHVVQHPTNFRKILFHEELEAIADSYEETLSENTLQDFVSQRSLLVDILAQTKATQSLATTGQEGFVDSVIMTCRDWFLVGAFEDRLGLEPAYLTMRGQSLTHEMKQLAQWRKQKTKVLTQRQEEKQLTGLQFYHLTLNLLSAFLYCMNYYIVEPSSTMYVNRLGAQDALSGTLIGMMPLAAFLASLPFSMWTNHSYRKPFIASGCLLVVGNLLYSMADRRKTVAMALLGRFVSGLGAPKCIIRRYMADTTPLSLRTSVNASFGMVVAAGSALGPAMAVLLNQIEYSTTLPYYGPLQLNGLTAPGFFMAGLWFTLTVILLLTFEEPTRDGLEEQMRMEAVGRAQSPVPEEWDENEGIKRNISHDQLSLASTAASEFGSYDARSTVELDPDSRFYRIRKFLALITFPVRLCLVLLFAKVFTIEALASATSALSKNRYKWKVQQVGTLGFVNGIMVIPFSILVGRLSLSFQDHVLMKGLVACGCFGMFLLIDLSDLVGTPTGNYNMNHPLAVGPHRYICGYFVSYLSIQSFEGVIGSTLSKVIPTALASGTINSGLLATMTDTLGRASGDMFISLMACIDIRQLMNLLFIPGFCIMMGCLIIIERYRDVLAV